MICRRGNDLDTCLRVIVGGINMLCRTQVIGTLRRDVRIGNGIRSRSRSFCVPSNIWFVRHQLLKSASLPYATRPRLSEVSWIQDFFGAYDNQHGSAGSFNMLSRTNPKKPWFFFAVVVGIASPGRTGPERQTPALAAYQSAAQKKR